MSNQHKLYMSKYLHFNNRPLVIVNRGDGGHALKGGNQEVAKPIITAWLKMEDACILCNVIKNFWRKKVTKTKKRRALWPFETPNGIGTIV
jgi:hypothetical protein